MAKVCTGDKGGLPPISVSPIHFKISGSSKGNWWLSPFFASSDLHHGLLAPWRAMSALQGSVVGRETMGAIPGAAAAIPESGGLAAARRGLSLIFLTLSQQSDRLAARGRSAVRTKNRVQPPIFVSTLIENTALMSHENRLAVPIFRRTHLHHGLLGAMET